MTIHATDLEFVTEAVKAFEENPRWETYRNKENTLIALRDGRNRDELVVYRLGEEVGEFVGMMRPGPELIIKHF
ncbi:hypothetical protein EauM23_00057 [Exiguobacterium phage vB_EauM-23]|nr:hypothetical protein EauM23_00057 [Exiguobacterium phage vB_EauM-23]